MTDRVGQTVGGYRLISLLGEGTFAQVYLGKKEKQNTQVAVKILKARLPNDESSNLLNLLKEARTIRLSHPHIVRILDFNVEKGTLFIVMEYAANGPILNRHPRGTVLSLE